MPATSIQSPFPIFTDIDGQPLEAGLIWLGTAGNNPISSPITAYWDAALTQVVTQPVTTRGGYPLNGTAVGRLYVNADYSILVRNRSGSDVLSALNATERYDSSLVTFIQAGAGAVARTVQSKLRDVFNVLDFGAVGDGVTNDTTAFQNANTAAAGRPVIVPPGSYAITGTLTGTYQAFGTQPTFVGGTVILNIIGKQTVRAATTQDGISLQGRAGGTSNYEVALTPTTLSASRTATFPDANITVAALQVAQTFSAQQTLTGGLVVQSIAAADIAAIANAINTTNKVQGKVVYDTTNNRLMVANGAAAADPWYVADGSASVTPA